MRIVPAETKHIGRIARLMREIDRRECRAMGRSPKNSLRAALAQSLKSWTALVDDRPEAMFGVIQQSVIDRERVAWFLGTDEVYRHGRELLMWGPGILSRLDDSTATLRNLVSAENVQAIRLLEKWGFTVSPVEQDVGGLAFRAFERQGERLCAPLPS